MVTFFFFRKRFYVFIFREENGRRKRGRETSMCGCPFCAPCAPLLQTWPASQACALAGNQTGDPLVCRPVLNPLSHTSQGHGDLLIEFEVSFPDSVSSSSKEVLRKHLPDSQNENFVSHILRRH